MIGVISYPGRRQMNRKERSLEKLTELLAGGRFPINSRLPPERELAPLLGLSRSALRQGLEALEAEERIWRRVGKGTFVGTQSAVGVIDLDALSALTSPAEVLEVRLLIEPLVARMAATRATAAEIAQMERLLDKADNAGDPSTWEGWDITLHRAVAQAGHNALLLAIFDAFNAMRRQPTWSKLRAASLTPERLRIYGVHHRTYVGAIAQRDAAGAEEAMRVHIDSVRDNLLGLSNGKFQRSSITEMRLGPSAGAFARKYVG
jgi:DNA-binding FadR family transcriptional regulator